MAMAHRPRNGSAKCEAMIDRAGRSVVLIDDDFANAERLGLTDWAVASPRVCAK